MKVSVTGGKTVRNEIFFLLLVLCGNPVNLFLVRIQVFAYTQNMHAYFLNYENVAYRRLFPDVFFSVSFGHIYISARRETDSSNVPEYVFQQ